MSTFEGADVLVTRFQGDTGQADPRLRHLLGDPETYTAQREIVQRLAEGRLLVPVVADLDQGGRSTSGCGGCDHAQAGGGCDDRGDDGECHDDGGKDSHMSTVTLTDEQGRKALLCFTGVDSVALWRADARPIPVAGVEAAQAALQEECDALLIDIAGPTRYALSGTGLWALAAGGPWRHPLDEPEVVESLESALAGSGLTGAFEVDASTIDGVALVLTDPDLARAQELAQALGRTPAVQARVSSLEFRLAR